MGTAAGWHGGAEVVTVRFDPEQTSYERLLEQAVGVHGCLPGGEEPEDECRECDAVQVCEPVTVEFKQAEEA